MAALEHVSGHPRASRSSRKSDAVKIGKLAYVFGVLPTNLEDDSKLLPELVEHQTEAVLNNLAAILKRCGVENGEIVAATVYTTKLSKFAERIGLVYGRRFPKDRLPTSSWVGVTELPRGALVAMDFVVTAKEAS